MKKDIKSVIFKPAVHMFSKHVCTTKHLKFLSTQSSHGKIRQRTLLITSVPKIAKRTCWVFIAQNVGAILENDDQNGLAHFALNTCVSMEQKLSRQRNYQLFRKKSVCKKFDLQTSTPTLRFDKTVYNLSDVPTIRETVIDSALLALHDWSGFVSLFDKVVIPERGVIREEWRTGAGADRRMWKESNKLKYPGSQYAKRDVIGDTAVINNFSYKTLRDYYHKWYRPDQQAILVVEILMWIK